MIYFSKSGDDNCLMIMFSVLCHWQVKEVGGGWGETKTGGGRKSQETQGTGDWKIIEPPLNDLNCDSNQVLYLCFTVWPYLLVKLFWKFLFHNQIIKWCLLKTGCVGFCVINILATYWIR